MDRRSAPRPSWSQLPEGLRSAIETAAGSRVVAAESRPGGWSPGSADRLRLADGRRVFAKAASADVNERTVHLHRREAEVLRLLAGSGVAPRLLAAVEHDRWFALVEEDVGGEHPDPSSPRDVAAVLDAVRLLPAAGAEARSVLRTTAEELADDAGGWRRLAADRALATVPVDAAEAAALDRLAARHRTALAGDRVVHLDLRPDNVLMDATGRARLVDWPSAVIGAGWIDAVTIALEVRRLAGRDAAAAAMAHPALADVAEEDVDVLLAVLGAYFFDVARRPPSPGLQGVRAFQRLQGGVVLAWLRERLLR